MSSPLITRYALLSHFGLFRITVRHTCLLHVIIIMTVWVHCTALTDTDTDTILFQHAVACMESLLQ